MKKFGWRAAKVALALIFGAAGFAKLVNPGMFEDQFARFGLPVWFVLATGAVELLGAALIGFFDDPYRRSGAALLALAMAVATSLHLIHDPLALALPAFALMLLSAYVALAPRRGRTQPAVPVV